MTMDVNHRKQIVDSEVRLLNNNEELTEVVTTKMPVKRSFDVAFLMLPDDKLKQRQLRAARQIASYERHTLSVAQQEDNETLKSSSCNPASSYMVANSNGLEDEDRRSDSDSPNVCSNSRSMSELQKIQNHAKYLHNIAQLNKHQQIFGDPSLGKLSSASKNVYDEDEDILVGASNSNSATVRLKIAPDSISQSPSQPHHHQHQQQKSAFTKVNLFSKEATHSRMSPSLSLSPDLSYQNSLSPSPPILRHQYQTFASPNLHVSPNHFKSAAAYQNTFLQENLGFAPVSNNHHQVGSSSAALMESAFLLKAGGNHHHHQQQQQLQDHQQVGFAKMRPVLQYRPDFPPYGAYPAFPTTQEMLKMGAGDGRIFSSLLPPSLAALSLPAQNVCAKCNISFRMTSDLVYHMRSHHKNDIANDMSKRRREEKLKCPVCAESFRERHHLTRHMTAHQDKEGDVLDGEEVHKKKGGAAGSSVAGAANFGVFNK